MKIRQDPITKLWCREDGAVLMPPTKRSRFKKFRWTFGTEQLTGYRTVWYRGKNYRVHTLICRAFHGLPPDDKPEVDHINRVKSANFASNLHWVSAKENAANQDCVDQSIEKYKVRYCEDPQAYRSAHNKDYAAKMKAQGFYYTKGPNGKWGWYPRIRT